MLQEKSMQFTISVEVNANILNKNPVLQSTPNMQPSPVVKNLQNNMISQYTTTKKPQQQRQLKNERKESTQIHDSQISSTVTQQNLTTLEKKHKEKVGVTETGKHTQMPWGQLIDELDPINTKATNAKAKQNQENQNSEAINFEDLVKMGYGEMKEKILKFRENDNFKYQIRNYVDTFEKKQKQQAKEDRQKRFDREMQHRQEMCDLVGATPRPMTLDYNKEYRKRVRNNDFDQNKIIETAKQKQIIQFNTQMQNQIIQRKQQFKKNKQMLSKHYEQSQMQGILPQTFIQQRNQLLTQVYLTSRLAILFTTSSKYSKINASNNHLVQNVNIINKYYRMHHYRSAWLANKLFASQLQCHLRRLSTIQKNQIRLQSLNNIKQFLLTKYQNSTFLAASLNLNKSALFVLEQLRKQRIRQAERVKLVCIKLEKCDKQLHRDYAALLAKKQYSDDLVKAKKQPQPDYLPNEQQILDQITLTEYMRLTDQELKYLAVLIVVQLQNEYRELLKESKGDGNIYGQYAQIVSLVPDDTSCERVIDAFRKHIGKALIIDKRNKSVKDSREPGETDQLQEFNINGLVEREYIEYTQ